MAPEYNRVYIPPEDAANFESFVGKIKGAYIGRKSLRNRDFPPPTAESLGIDELGQRARIAITQLPAQTRLIDLTHWNYSERSKKDDDIHTPEAWVEFMRSLNIDGRKLVTRVINGLYYQAFLEERHAKVTIVELGEIDWVNAPKPRNIGVKGMTFLSTAFSKQTAFNLSC